MPKSEATIEPHEALRQLRAFMAEHEAHGGKPYIEDDLSAITLFCGAHSPRVYEILTMDRMELRRAMGQELLQSRAL